jgi:hypothetical protein
MFAMFAMFARFAKFAERSVPDVPDVRDVREVLLLKHSLARPATAAGLTTPKPTEAEAASDHRGAHAADELRAPSGEQGRPLQVDRRVEQRL